MVLELKRGYDKKQLAEITKQLGIKKYSNNLKRWCGIISLNKDPLAIQKEMRDEWGK